MAGVSPDRARPASRAAGRPVTSRSNGRPDPFATAPDGAAKDPAAYAAALRGSPEKLKALTEARHLRQRARRSLQDSSRGAQADPALAAVLLGGDVKAMQSKLRQARRVGRDCLAASLRLPASPVAPCSAGLTPPASPASWLPPPGTPATRTRRG